MNILLLHSYTRQNKGDAAILSVMLQDLKKRFPFASLRISTMEDISIEKEFEGVPQVTSLFYAIVYKPGTALTKVLRLLYIPKATFLWAVTYKLFGWRLNFLLPKDVVALMHALAGAEKVVGVGGGYINGSNTLKSTVSLLITLYEFWLAAFFEKEITLYPQSVGPFGNRFQVLAARYVLNKIQTIQVRERISESLLKNMNVHAKVEYAPDAAFSFVSREKENIRKELEAQGIDFSKPVVGITVRAWLPPKKQEAYELAFAEFANYVAHEKDMQVVFIPQVTSPLHNDDDREVQKRIQSLLENQANIRFLEKNYTHYELKGICENLNFLVGTRMHSVIFAMTSAVPCVAIEYEYKTSGIMSGLKLEEWVIGIQEVRLNNLISSLNRLMTQRRQYLEKLQVLDNT